MIRVNEWLAWAETTPRFWPGTTARKCYGMEAAIVRRAVRRAPEARRGTESNGLQHSSSIRPRQPRRNPQCSRGQPRPPKWRTCNNKSSDQSYDVAAPEPKVWRKRRKIIEFCRRKEGALFVTFKLCWQSCRLCQTRVGKEKEWNVFHETAKVLFLARIYLETSKMVLIFVPNVTLWSKWNVFLFWGLNF